MTAKITGIVIDKGTQIKKDGTQVPYTALYVPQDGETVKVSGLDVDLDKTQYTQISVDVTIRAFNGNLYVNKV